ncbi:MAG: hypothetical protein IID40_06790 [Planctomycetes bacterium]|nr:hypothetical protein [Planctomycetota bacterium]
MVGVDCNDGGRIRCVYIVTVHAPIVIIQAADEAALGIVDFLVRRDPARVGLRGNGCHQHTTHKREHIDCRL